MIDEARRIIGNMRVCCGDIPLDEDMDCGEVCANPRDMRNGELRFCRQWLMKDAANIIEALCDELDKAVAKGVQLEIELEQVKRERDAAVKDIEYLLSEGTLACDFCKNIDTCTYNSFEDTYCKPTWRGIKGE